LVLPAVRYGSYGHQERGGANNLDGVKVTAGRGGEQQIPRPVEWSVGGPAPWAHLSETKRQIDLGKLANTLAVRPPGTSLTGAPPPKRDSAVLIPLWDDGGEAAVILTRRTRAMRAHSGEVSFPGGGQDEGETLWQTAVREAEEEIGLPRHLPAPIGELDHLVTFSSQARIHPYVARLDAVPELTPSPVEVDRILAVDLSVLAADGVFREERWRMPQFDDERTITFFELDGDTVWGATASLLRQLLVVAFDLEN
jgi:8-oxo-dGTP pyrophosphatase MutT (NUDIX family)